MDAEYRILRFERRGRRWYEIHAVYPSVDGEPPEHGIVSLSADDPIGLISTIADLSAALAKPVLDASSLAPVESPAESDIIAHAS